MAEQALNPNLNLKEERERKGLTLEIVHEATKVPLDALKAIEQGYSVRILTPFYYRGFIKIYAEFLGLNVQDVYKSYNVERPVAPVVQASLEAEQRAAKIKAEPKPKPARAFRQAPVPPKPRLTPSVITQVRENFALFWTAKNRRLLGRTAGVLAAVAAVGFLIFKISGCVADQMKKPKAKTAVKAAARPQVKARAVAAPVKPRPVSAPQPSKAAAAVPAQAPAPAPAGAADNRPSAAAVQSKEPVPGKVELVVRAPRNSWIQVKADGAVVFSMTMQKGTVETWSAKDEIELSGRNIGDMEIEVNGKNLGKLGSTYRHARKVLITKDGISVKK